MARKRSRPMDMQVMCSLWQDEDFRGLSSTAQWYCFKSIGIMGVRCSTGGIHFTNVDLGLEPMLFDQIAPELVRLGVWSWIDDYVVEVWPYKNLIQPIRHTRARLPIATRVHVLNRDGHACRECGSTKRLEMDHVHPWSLGGSDDESNLQTLCRSCNYRKGAST